MTDGHSSDALAFHMHPSFSHTPKIIDSYRDLVRSMQGYIDTVQSYHETFSLSSWAFLDSEAPDF